MAFYFLTFGKKRICSGIRLGLSIVFLFITTFAYAGTAKLAQVVKAAESTQLAEKAVLPEPEPLSPAGQITDIKQQAYMNYMSSTLSVLDGNYIEAIKSLKKVLEIDPESGFLNKKMAILMHQTKNTD